MNQVYLTHEGLKKIQGDLNRLVNEVRPKVAQSLADARSKGDLSENAEYDAAREELASVDRQIMELQQKMSRIHLIDENAIATDEVRVLSDVTLLNLNNKKEVKYTIVDPLQADPSRALISLQSPIAKGLLGKKVGEEVCIQIPSGELKLKILSIERNQNL